MHTSSDLGPSSFLLYSVSLPLLRPTNLLSLLSRTPCLFLFVAQVNLHGRTFAEYLRPTSAGENWLVAVVCDLRLHEHTLPRVPSA